MTWHVDPRTSAGYRAGALTDAAAASVDAHLLHCPACRAVLAVSASPADLAAHDRTWAGIDRALDAEPASAAERVLGRVLPSYLVRLLTAAPAVQAACWAAGTGLLVLAWLAARLGPGTVGTAVFVVSAPLLPLAGVALAYAADDDVAGGVARTTPFSRFRLLLIRTAAVAAVTLPVTALLALALPGGARPATLWLAPTLALCALTLALSARRDPRRVATVLTVLWLAGSWSALRPAPRLPLTEALERAVAFRPPGQVALLCVAALAVALAVTRRTTFEDRSRR
jgi:Putative zinc-finger